MKNLLKQLDLRDYHAYTGLILLSIGCGLIYRPLALIVAGIVLLHLGLRRPI